MANGMAWVEEPHRFKVLYEGRLLTAYNKGNPQYGDFFKAFPNIEPVHTLSGLPATTGSAANFNHHKSIFLGLGRLGGPQLLPRLLSAVRAVPAVPVW